VRLTAVTGIPVEQSKTGKAAGPVEFPEGAENAATDGTLT
jgi:hypothetical protein